MNVIHFSPHFPDNYYRFSTALRELGANPLGIGDAAYDELRPELRAALGEYYRVDSMEDYEQVYRAVAYLCFRHGRAAVLDSFNEYWMQTEARLRSDFNIPGLNLETIGPVKRKSLMKEKFRQAGIAVARGRVVRTTADAEAFVAEVGYPVIAKPDIGVGALNTYKLCREADLRQFCATRPAADYIMEEFIDGDILTFDGLTDQDGKPVFYTSHTYMCGIMETVLADSHVYYYSLRELPRDLEAAGLSALRAFDLRARFFHFEFFRRRSDGKIVALEVNARPPGGYTTDMFNFANDIDIYREWANVVVHNRFTAKYTRPYHCAYIGRKARYPYARSHEQVVAELGERLVHHSPISGVFSSALGDYGYLVRAPSLDEIFAAVRVIHS